MSAPLTKAQLDQEKAYAAKRRVQAAAYRTVHLIVFFFAFVAALVAILAAISFWTWRTIVFATEAGVAVLILILAILDDVYAYSVVLILTVAGTGWNLYVLIEDCAVFYKILPAVFNPNYVPDNCPQPYCTGYRADTFWAFYLLLALLCVLGIGAISVYASLFAAEADVSRRSSKDGSSIVVNNIISEAEKNK
jgi:hypothetical protein